MQVLKFFKYIFWVVLCICIIDVIVRFAVTPTFKNLPNNTKAYATYKFISCNEPANVIIMGASAANHNYVPSVIKDSTNMSCFNYGWDGRCVFYQYLSLLKAIDNGDVKVAIIDMGSALFCNEWVYDRISDLYPYYWMNDTIKSIVDEVKGKSVRLLMASSMIQYNSQYLNFVAPVKCIDGYTPLPYKGKPVEIKEPTQKDDMITEEDIAPIALDYFHRLVTICNQKGIKLIGCKSPKAVRRTVKNNIVENLCKKENVELWDYSKFINDPYLFSDGTHLNDKGAVIYSAEIARRLNSFLSEKSDN